MTFDISVLKRIFWPMEKIMYLMRSFIICSLHQVDYYYGDLRKADEINISSRSHINDMDTMVLLENLNELDN
jgi:hypothetical protein